MSWRHSFTRTHWLSLPLQGHFAAVTALALAPDGWTLLSAGRDKVAVAWDLRKQTKLRTTPLYEAVEGGAQAL